jgi:hypothetical protein
MSWRALVSVVLLVVLSGGCSLAGRTFGTYIDDKVISSSVRRGIAGGHWRVQRGVNVDTYERTVYLSGHVDTAAQKAEAEAAAWHVEGVEQVINDLSVRSGSGIAVSASPRTTEVGALGERIPGLRQIDPAPPGGPALAYDSAGTVVATVFVRSLRDISLNGFDEAAFPFSTPTFRTGRPPPSSATRAASSWAPCAAAPLRRSPDACTGTRGIRRRPLGSA